MSFSNVAGRIINMRSQEYKYVSIWKYKKYKKICHFEMWQGAEEEESSPGLLGRLGQARNGFTRWHTGWWWWWSQQWGFYLSVHTITLLRQKMLSDIIKCNDHITSQQNKREQMLHIMLENTRQNKSIKYVACNRTNVTYYLCKYHTHTKIKYPICSMQKKETQNENK